MKNIILLVIILIPLVSVSQNIGINTENPTALFHLKANTNEFLFVDFNNQTSEPLEIISGDWAYNNPNGNYKINSGYLPDDTPKKL
jgi:hypothetical protein